MADHLVDDEPQELFPEIGIELGVFGQPAESRDLALLTRRVGWRKRVFGLVGAHRLGDAEPLGEHMDQRRIDVVDAGTEAGKDRIGCGGVAVVCHPAGR